MVLPLILSLLGSGAAGAGLLGTSALASPLIAGALGSGLGSAIETGDLKEGIKTGLTSAALGGIGGMLMGGASGAAPGLLDSTATNAVTSTGMTNAPAVNELANLSGAQMLPSAATSAAAPAAATGIKGMFQSIPSGMAPVGQAATDMTVRDIARQGLNQGVMSGAGMGTAAGAAMSMQPEPFATEDYPYIPQADPANRERFAPPAGYNAGTDGEFSYFGPRAPSRFAEMSPQDYYKKAAGGKITVPMQEGGIAPRMAEMSPGGLGDVVGAMQSQMNEKDIVKGAIAAVQNQMPEEQAAVVLAKFVETYGEPALRKLVDDVKSGRAPGTAGQGKVQGPGDGMADMVPARMDDGSSDVLLSDGEFVVPADVVSGLGNGSTDAGASELERMMSRVRKERTGKTEQPAAMYAGGVMPA